MTDMVCDVVPYTICKMQMAPVPTKETRVFENNYKVQKCEETTGFHDHIKQVPVCRNVTKQNCVTKWEVDSKGKKVTKHNARNVHSKINFFKGLGGK